MNKKIKSAIQSASTIEDVCKIVETYNRTSLRNNLSVENADAPDAVNIRLTINLNSGPYTPRFSGFIKKL